MPRFTSDCGSPCVATTCPSFTATLTPQPTPQNRHGAFDHLSWAWRASVTMLVARTGTGELAAAVAAAERMMNCLRVVMAAIAPAWCSRGLICVKSILVQVEGVSLQRRERRVLQ